MDLCLSIYNSLGEKVEELVNGNQDAGNHSVTFNAKNLSEWNLLL